MANSTKATETTKETKTATPAESVYTRKELADNHKVFNTRREIVDVALFLAGLEKATLTEAKTIVEKFKNKEVK